MRGMVRQSALMSTLLALLLCAGCMTVSVEGPRQIKCLDLIPEELWADTPHAKPPADASSKEWVNFGVGEAGQLNKANEEKRVVHQICLKVDAANEAALKQAKKSTRRWWQLF